MGPYEVCVCTAKPVENGAESAISNVVGSWLLELLDEPGVKHAMRLSSVAYLHRSAPGASVQAQHSGKSTPLLANPAMVRTIYRSMSQCRVAGDPTIDLFIWLRQRFCRFEMHPQGSFLQIEAAT